MGKATKPQINNDDERLCLKCNQWFPQIPEYWYSLHGRIRTNYCKVCTLERHPSVTGTTATWRVLLIPHTFKHEIQRQDTHHCLQLMGWRYNESGKYWYKPGIVDKKGKWLNIPKGTPKAGSYILTEEEREEIRQTYDGDQDEFMSKYNISKYNLNSALKGRGSVGRPFLDKERRENGGIIYDQVPPENRKVPFKKRMTENEKLEVIQMAEEGTDHWEIANEFERSITTIRKIIYKDNEKQRENRQRR